MAYIPDNAVCRCFPFEAPSNLLAIGWLAGTHDFPRGPVPRAFFLKLLDLLRNPWQPIGSCGYHICELCQFTGGGDADFEGRTIPGRSIANVFVPYKGNIFVAPELIAHYINSHHYLPPDRFLDAVVHCPEMNSMPYKNALLENGGRELLKNLKDAQQAAAASATRGQ